jgi:hypothetical protein
MNEGMNESEEEGKRREGGRGGCGVEGRMERVEGGGGGFVGKVE